MENKVWIIYKHTNIINNKCYIGQTCKTNPEYRWQEGKGYNSQTKFARAIKKYGWENFTHEILESNIKTQAEADLKECYYIKLFNSFIDGYNLTSGGHQNRIVSEETKNRQSKALLGHTYICTEETKKKISKANKGRHLSRSTEWYKGQTPWNKGKTLTEEHKKHLSESHKGQIPSCKGKPSPRKGKKLPEETIQKMREAWKGKPRSPKQIEALKKLHEKRRNKKLQTTKEGE